MIENNKTERVTRVEIIDETGRAVVMTNLASVKLSLQDDERTLKLFVTHKSPTPARWKGINKSKNLLPEPVWAAIIFKEGKRYDETKSQNSWIG